MKLFSYKIVHDEISAFSGEIETVPAGYFKLDASMGGDSIYYKIENGKITDAIGEANHEEAARRRVEELISSLNVNLF